MHGPERNGETREGRKDALAYGSNTRGKLKTDVLFAVLCENPFQRKNYENRY